MATIITGLFENQATGQAAAEDLRRRGFSSSAVRVLSGAQADTAALAQLGLRAADVSAFSATLRNGGAVVSAVAQFGEAGRVAQALEKHGPLETRSTSGEDFGDVRASEPTQVRDERAADRSGRVADEAAPFSDRVNMPVLARSDAPRAGLISDRASPFSDFFRLPVLARSQTPNVKLSSNDPAPFSRMLGLPLLTRDRGPAERAVDATADQRGLDQRGLDQRGAREARPTV
jgi:hypothetical protein